MDDPIDAFKKASGLAQPDFAPSSRYANVPVAHWVTPDGRHIRYVRRRFLPDPEEFALLHQHRVEQGDRLDNLADKYYSDPQEYWRICDSNATANPDDLTRVPGARIRITLPQGIPAPEEDL